VQNGFNLIEMAIVLIILSLLLTSLLPALSIQREASYRQKTKEKLEEIKEALLGFVITDGRLPCPATNSSDGREAKSLTPPAYKIEYSEHEERRLCDTNHGFVPAVTLGLTGYFNVDNLLIDAWGNPYRYSLSGVGQVADEPSYCLPKQYYPVSSSIEIRYPPILSQKNEMKLFRIECFEAKLKIYDHIDKETKDLITDKLPVIIYSLGSEISEDASPEEEENMETTLGSHAVSNDNIFILSDKEGFNHIFTWISPHILYNRIIASGVY